MSFCWLVKCMYVLIKLYALPRAAVSTWHCRWFAGRHFFPGFYTTGQPCFLWCLFPQREKLVIPAGFLVSAGELPACDDHNVSCQNYMMTTNGLSDGRVLLFRSADSCIGICSFSLYLEILLISLYFLVRWKAECTEENI